MRYLIIASMISIMLLPAVTAAADYANLSFLSGCWVGDGVEEQWGTQNGGVMLGASKSTKDGVTRSFEFLRIQTADTAVVYTPYIGGVETVSFVLSASTDTSARFENLKHDFPQVIQYEAIDGVLRVTLSGGDKKMSYDMARIDCGSGDH